MKINFDSFIVVSAYLFVLAVCFYPFAK